MSKKPIVSISDDYAVLTVGDLYFYFGYEETYCSKHGVNSSEKCYDTNCEKLHDCFVARKGNKELMRVPRNKLTKECGLDCHEYLLMGIGEWLSVK